MTAAGEYTFAGWIKGLVLVWSLVRCVVSLKLPIYRSRLCQSDVFCCCLHWQLWAFRVIWRPIFGMSIRISSSGSSARLIPPRGSRSRASKEAPLFPWEPTAGWKPPTHVPTSPVVWKHISAEFVKPIVTSNGFLYQHIGSRLMEASVRRPDGTTIAAESCAWTVEWASNFIWPWYACSWLCKGRAVTPLRPFLLHTLIESSNFTACILATYVYTWCFMFSGNMRFAACIPPRHGR